MTVRPFSAADDEAPDTTGVRGLVVGSPDWTRTNNLPVNSRLLCQLSYRGMLPGNHSKGIGPTLNRVTARRRAPQRPISERSRARCLAASVATSGSSTRVPLPAMTCSMSAPVARS